MTKIKISIIITLLISIGSYFTPYLVVHQVNSALKAKDAIKLSKHVNFPALRESLKASFNAQLMSNITNAKNNSGFAVLSIATAATLINTMVDGLVTPESLAMIMNRGQLPQEENTTKSTLEDIEPVMAYEDFNHFIITVKGTNAQNAIGFVFSRDGIINWKLITLRLPINRIASQVALATEPKWKYETKLDDFTDKQVSWATITAEKNSDKSFINVVCSPDATIEFKIGTGRYIAEKDISNNVMYRVDKNEPVTLTMKTFNDSFVYGNDVDSLFLSALQSNGLNILVQLTHHDYSTSKARFSLKGAKEAISKVLTNCEEVKKAILETEKTGVVKNEKRGLMWMRCSLGQTWNGSTCKGKAEGYKSVELAINTAKYYSYTGYSDWRLPTLSESKTLIYCSKGWSPKNKYCNDESQIPTIDTVKFPNAPNDIFWTSSMTYDYSKPTAKFIRYNVVGSKEDVLFRIASRLGAIALINGTGTGKSPILYPKGFHIRLVRNHNINEKYANEKFPNGWRLPTSMELSHDNSLRDSSPSQYTIVVEDFNGDKKLDYAFLLVGTQVEKLGLFVKLSTANDYEWKLVDESDYGIVNIGIERAEPDEYETWCFRAYGKCDNGEPEKVNLKNGGIFYIAFESLSLLWYWDSVTNKFKTVSISD